MPTAINKALIGLVLRAEHNDSKLLVNTFVDIGLLGDLLSTPNNQIIYGRRGTGKTHALSYLSEKLELRGDLSLSIDLRKVGSNSSIYDSKNPNITQRVSQLLLDVGNDIYFKLQEVLLEKDLLDTDAKFARAYSSLEKLAEGLNEIRVEGEITIENSFEDSSGRSSETSFTGSAGKDLSLGMSIKDGHQEGSKVAEKVGKKGSSLIRVHFGAITNPVEDILRLVNKRLYILLDEWSSIPEDLQPYLADMIRHTLFPVRGITLKIAAIEQRSYFKVPVDKSSYVGFELGADISADVNLDDFMVFDNDASKSVEFFKNLFHRHIIGNPDSNIKISPEEFIRQGFTQINAFEELVRSAEGVPRDAINIAMLAAQSANNEAISIPNIRSSARKWYQRDKEKSIEGTPDAERFLQHIIHEVIGNRKARAFLVEQREAISNEFLKYLYDNRILHVLKKSVSSNDAIGKRFTVFKIDYGCYVDLLNTSNSPLGLFSAEGEDGEITVEVPQDDYRSIRRAILDSKTLEKFTTE